MRILPKRSARAALPPGMPSRFVVGVDASGELATEGSRVLGGAETIRLLVEEARLAEAVDLDVFSVGEHCRPGHDDSTTPVVLAAVASATARISLGTAVTVLSTHDPVRLYRQFSTLDAVSSGRAQIVLGRGSARESFALFGFNLADYERLFDEKLDLFLRLRREEAVTGSGCGSSALGGEVAPAQRRPDGIPLWIGGSGTPASAVRAAQHGLPLMMAIMGGRPHRFSGHVALYERAVDRAGHGALPIGQHSLGLVADTDEEAREAWWSHWQPVVAALAEERGFYAPTRERFIEEVEHGALFVGSVETVSRKIATMARDLHLSRFDLKYDIMHLPRDVRARSIALLGSEVAPRVRELLARD